MNEYVFKVPDMSCGHCKSRIEGAFEKRDDVDRYTVDLDAKEVTVSSSASRDDLAEMLDDIGYPVES
jgi:copper chaperone